MRKWLCILSLALLAACGGGEPADQPVANEPAACAPAENPELEELLKTAASFHEAFPEVPRWDGPVKRPPGFKDGTERLRKLGAIAATWHEAAYSDDVPTWMLLRAGIFDVSRQGDRLEPSREDMLKALKESALVAEEMEALRGYDGFFLFVYGTEDVKGLLGLGHALILPVIRAMLLVSTGYEELAVKELSAWSDVLYKIDANACHTARLLTEAGVQVCLRSLSGKELADLALNEQLYASLSRLRETDAKGFWQLWANGLAYSAWYIGTRPEEVTGEPPTKLQEMRQDLKHRMYLLEKFGKVGLDPTEADVYSEFRRLYVPMAESWYPGLVELAVFGWLRYRALWLGFDLARMDMEEPLIGREQAIKEFLKPHPQLTYELDKETRELKLKGDPTHLLYRDADEWELRELASVQLREVPSEKSRPGND
ncbi:MAG: hypothetical protein ICCCNLDF_03546 [Planctomycetes bacterium]|nr:hypothetical protein [Planctomycetota bacterium]